MKPVESYELDWAQALAQEHGHQRELLATLRGDLGTFATECAAALTSLDAIVELGGVVGLLDAAKSGSRNAALGRDIARRLPGLSRDETPRNHEAAAFYTGFGRGGVGPQELVQQAGKLLQSEPQRGDRQLLSAVIDAAAARSVIEQVVGPATVAALGALAPLAHWVPYLAKLRPGEEGHGAIVDSARNDLTKVLESTAAADGESISDGSVALATSLVDTVEHVEAASRAISEGRLDSVVREARRQLEADLDELRAVQEKAVRAPQAWHAVRRTEHAALTEEVREKLEKVEKLRTVLLEVVPHLQLTARALANVEKLRSADGQLDSLSAAGVDAARMSLLLVAADAWEASLPEPRHAVTQPKPRMPRRWLIGAAVVLAAAVIAIVVSLTGGSAKKGATPDTILNVTPVQGIPPAPTVSPLRSTFNAVQKATFYVISVTAAHQGTTLYSWHLTPPKNDPGCNKFGTVIGAPNRAVWHHAATDGCTHAGAQQLGTVTVTVTTRYWQCTESFVGSLTSSGSPPTACKRV
jgi:hypothetical protein